MKKGMGVEKEGAREVMGLVLQHNEGERAINVESKEGGVTVEQDMYQGSSC